MLFVDSDDYIANTLCEQAVMQLSMYPEVDTVQWGYDYFQDNTNELIHRARPILESEKCVFQPEIKENFVSTLTVSYEDLYEWFEKGGKYYEVVFSKKRGGFVWTYLLSRDVIVKNSLEFPIVKYAEDIIFITKYLLRCNGIVNIDKQLYFYRNRETSTMHEKRPVDAKIKALEAKEEILKCIPENEWESMREKWQGQTCIIAMNGARVESLKDYLTLMKSDAIRIAVKKFEIKKANLQFKFVMGLLKFHLYIPYWLAIKLAMKMGKFKNNTDIC